MTKRQAMRYVHLLDALDKWGVLVEEVDTLLRAERTLTRWAERECGDGSDWAIERDEATDKPFNVYHGPGKPRRYSIPDREAGALKRVAAICKAHGLTHYHQSDPRGCAIYIIRPGDIPIGPHPCDLRPKRSVESCYTNGIAVCVD